jgi:hypothetical protein
VITAVFSLHDEDVQRKLRLRQVGGLGKSVKSSGGQEVRRSGGQEVRRS